MVRAHISLEGRKSFPGVCLYTAPKIIFPLASTSASRPDSKLQRPLLHRMHLRLAQYSCRTTAYEVQRRTINILNPALKQTRLPIIKNSDEFQGLRNWSQWRQAIVVIPDLKLQRTFCTECTSASLNTVAEPPRTKHNGEPLIYWIQL